MHSKSSTTRSRLRALLALSHELGREERQLALLGEGNTSARLSERTFLVKASGFNLATLDKSGTTECQYKTLLPLLTSKPRSDSAVHDALLASRVSPVANKPSVEAIFHAFLLTLPGVSFVGHTHPIAVNGLLCSKHARLFARRRLFPDEVVCCGTESVFVPYTDPGLHLALAIRRQVIAFINRFKRPPRIVLIESHGLIALGATPESVLAATLMCSKAAEIYSRAAAVAGAPKFLSQSQVARIAGRADEHYRQKVLGL